MLVLQNTHLHQTFFQSVPRRKPSYILNFEAKVTVRKIKTEFTVVQINNSILYP